MTAKTLNVRLPEALYLQLEELANATARTKTFLAVEALNSYLQNEAWQIRDIKKGLAEADAQEFASAEEVNAVWAKEGGEMDKDGTSQH